MTDGYRRRMPWEDPATAFGALGGPQAPLPPPEIAARQARAAAKQAAEMKVRAGAPAGASYP